jgi:hypothetical protein
MSERTGAEQLPTDGARKQQILLHFGEEMTGALEVVYGKKYLYNLLLGYRCQLRWSAQTRRMIASKGFVRKYS